MADGGHARLLRGGHGTMDHVHRTPTKRTELQMARSMCWHCQSEVTGEYFCEQCVKVQPVSKNTDYFTCLGIPRRLKIDTSQLESKFYELSRAFHPDFYQNKTAEEQEISLSNSALLNTAYRTLKDPIQRAEYLVRLEAGAAKDITARRPVRRNPGPARGPGRVSCRVGRTGYGRSRSVAGQARRGPCHARNPATGDGATAVRIVRLVGRTTGPCRSR
jgi:hypothetical protein